MSDERGPGYEYFVNPQLPPTGAPPGAHQGRDSSWALDPDTFHHTPVPTGYPMPRWLVALIVLIGGLITLSLVAAVAIPVFLSQRAKAEWKSTTVALPASFQGARKTTSPTLERLGQATGTGFSSTAVGIYQKSPDNLILMIAARPEQAMNTADEESARAGFLKGFASSNQNVDLKLKQEDDAGDLGGWLGCGAAGQAEVCVATDAGSMVAVVMGPGVQDPVNTARAAREATVTRK